MGKGYMSGSPFHVENKFYKYAMEHEDGGYRPEHEVPTCKYYVTHGNCNLHNSGFQRCMSFKCPFYCEELRVSSTCTQCAYFMYSTCFHPKVKNNTNFSAASYCGFFVGDSHKSKYDLIQRKIKCAVLEKRITTCEKTIMRCEKDIRKTKKEFFRPTTTNEDYELLKQKIAHRNKEIVEKKIKLDALRKQLAAIKKGRK